MARKSDGEKIDELQVITAALNQQMLTLSKKLDELSTVVANLAQTVSDLRREFEKEMALVKSDIAELKRWRDAQQKDRDEWHRRFWAFGPNVLGAIISGVIAAAVAYWVSRS
jgi:hypothetical protein